VYVIRHSYDCFSLCIIIFALTAEMFPACCIYSCLIYLTKLDFMFLCRGLNDFYLNAFAPVNMQCNYSIFVEFVREELSFCSKSKIIQKVTIWSSINGMNT
jgi:hypothetical protein